MSQWIESVIRLLQIISTPYWVPLLFFLSLFVLSILYIHAPRVLHLKVDLCVYLYFLVYGKNVAAVVEQPLEEEKMHPGKNTVTFEARELKSLFMRLVWQTLSSMVSSDRRYVYLNKS